MRNFFPSSFSLLARFSVPSSKHSIACIGSHGLPVTTCIRCRRSCITWSYVCSGSSSGRKGTVKSYGPSGSRFCWLATFRNSMRQPQSSMVLSSVSITDPLGTPPRYVLKYHKTSQNRRST